MSRTTHGRGSTLKGRSCWRSPACSLLFCFVSAVILFRSGANQDMTPPVLEPDLLPLTPEQDFNMAPPVSDLDLLPLTPVQDFSLRLMDGPTRHEGRLEVFYNGTWGTICDHYFAGAAAMVACRALGLRFSAAELRRHAYYPLGTGPVWLRNVDCSGLEPSFDSCDYDKPPGNTGCNHVEDIGVACLGDPLTPPPPPMPNTPPGAPTLDPFPLSETTQAPVSQRPSHSMPPWSHACTVHLEGGIEGRLSFPRISCWSSASSEGDVAQQHTFSSPCDDRKDDLVRIRVGSSLAALLDSGDLLTCGVEVVASNRAATDDTSGSEASPDSAPAIEDWGITFLDVPHVRLVDSVVANLPLSTVGPLLQFFNCTYVSMQNVTLQNLKGRPPCIGRATPSSGCSRRVLYGAVHAQGAAGVTFLSSICSNITASRGWACLLMVPTTNITAGAFLEVANCSVSHNSVMGPGPYGTQCDGTVQLPSLGDSLTVPPSGYGAFLVMQPLGGQANAPKGWLSAPPLIMWMEDNDVHANIGGCGSVGSVAAVIPEAAATAQDQVLAHSMHVTISNCSISQNIATQAGGVFFLSVSSRLGALRDTYVRKGSSAVAVSSTNVSGNSARVGGALFVHDRGASLSFAKDSNVNGNIAYIDGGALHMDELGGRLVIENSNFTANRAYGNGGVICLGRLSGTLLASNSNFSDNVALGLGGGVLYIHNLVGVLSCSGTHAINNSALGKDDGDGGIVLVTALKGEMFLCNKNIWEGNNATYFGGAVSVNQFDGRITICNDTTLSHNSAKTGGGLSLWQWVGDLTVSAGSSIDGNLATTNDGGGVYAGSLSGRFLLIGNSSVSMNSAARCGGAFYVENLFGSLELRDGSYISGNTALRGGALFVLHAMSTLSLSNGSTLSGNTARSSGGAVHCSGNIATVKLSSGSSFRENTGFQGGAISTDGSIGQLTVDGGSGFLGNSATFRGGSVYAAEGIEHVSLTRQSELSYSSAGDHGGAVFAPYITHFSVLNSLIHWNFANNGGAVSSAFIAQLLVMNSTFQSNSALQSGGAIFSSFSTFSRWHLNGSALVNNTAAIYGGAIHVAGACPSKAVSDIYGPCENWFPTTFLPSATGLHATLQATDSIGAMHISQGLFGRNQAGQGGGALSCLVDAQHIPLSGQDSSTGYQREALLRLSEATFRHNTVLNGNGGALFAYIGSQTLIDGCSFFGNHAEGRGGALAAEGCRTMVVKGSAFDSNAALEQGGSISSQGCELTVIINTNSSRGLASSGGGIHLGGRSTSSLSIIASSELNGNAAVLIPASANILNATDGYGGGVFIDSSHAGHVLITDSNLTTNMAWLGRGIATFQSCAAGQSPPFHLSAQAAQFAAVPNDEALLSAARSVTANLLEREACSLLLLSPCFNRPSDVRLVETAYALPTANIGATNLLWDSSPLFPPQQARVLWADDRLLSGIYEACTPDDSTRATASGAPDVDTTTARKSTIRYSVQQEKEQAVNGQDPGNPLAVYYPLTNTLDGLPWVETPIAYLQLDDTSLCHGDVLADVLTLRGNQTQCGALTTQTGSPTSLNVRLIDHQQNPVSSVPDSGSYKAYLSIYVDPLDDAIGTNSSLQGMVLSATGSTNFAVYACLPTLSQAVSLAGTCNRSSAVVYIRPAGDTEKMRVKDSAVEADFDHRGVARWDGLVITGWPGQYIIRVRLEGPRQVPPIFIRANITGCKVGEFLDLQDSSAGSPTLESVALATCTLCPRRQVGLTPDTRPSLLALSNISEYLTSLDLISYQGCLNCPNYATCPGGDVLVPLPGFWHSAPSSTQVHRCPFAEACKDLNNQAARQLANWSGSTGALQLLDSTDDRTHHLYMWQYSAGYSLASIHDYGMPWFNATSITGAGSSCNGSQDSCVLNSPLGSYQIYMRQLCADGYTGNLCAACQPGFTLSADFQCSRCPSLSRTLGTGLAAFVVTVFVILWVSITNYEAGNGDADDDKIAPGDMLKVGIVHVQYFVIIMYLPIHAPQALSAFTRVLAAITGAQEIFSFSHACLLRDQDSAGQAKLQLLGALFTPCAATVVVLALWAIRYTWLSFGKTRRSPAFRRSIGSNVAASLPRQFNSSRSADFGDHLKGMSQNCSRNTYGASESLTSGAGGLQEQGSQGSTVRTSSIIVKISDFHVSMRQQLSKLSRMTRTTANSLPGLAYTDRALTLPQQLGMVLTMSAFVLYPSWAQAAFSVFSCQTVDWIGHTQMEHFMAAWRSGYWLRNMNQECYTGIHARFYVPLGALSLLVFCLAPPMTALLLMWHARHRLKDVHTQHVYGFMYKRYRPRYFWWDSVLQVQTLVLVAVNVFARAVIVQYQALMLLAVLSTIAGVNTLVSPLRHKLLWRLEFASFVVLSLTITLSMYFITGDVELIDGPEGAAIAIIIIILNIGFITVLAIYLWRTAWPKLKPWLHVLGETCCLHGSQQGVLHKDTVSDLPQSPTALHRDISASSRAGIDGACDRDQQHDERRAEVGIVSEA